MEENQINDDSNLEEQPAERSLEEQLEVTKLTMIKERNRGKQLEKENRELKKQQEAQQKQLAQLQQQFEMFSLGGEKANTDVVPPQEKRPEAPDVTYQQAAKQVVSGLQLELAQERQEKERLVKEKQEIALEKAILQAFVEANGILNGDPSILQITDVEDYPLQTITRRLKPFIRVDEDGLYLVDKNENVEMDNMGARLSLASKMQQLKNAGSYQSCFKSDNNNIGMGTPSGSKNNYAKGASVRSSKDMATGKVKLEDILNGKAVIRD